MIAYALSVPVAARAAPLRADERALPAPSVARKTWRYFETFVDRRRSLAAARQLPGCEPEPTRRAPHLADQHRHGPALDARRARPRLHRRRDELVAAPRRDADHARGAASATKATSSTGTTRRRWRRCCRATSRRSTAATSPGALHDAARIGARGDARRADARRARARRRSSTRCTSGSCYDPQAAALLDRLPPAPTPTARAGSTRRSTTCWPRRRGWPASSPSPRATCPQTTGSISAAWSPASTARRCCCRGARTMFEYLMPLLLMRSYPGHAARRACRLACGGRSTTARQRGVPWGISESAYNADRSRTATISTGRSACPGLGLKRGLGDELVVAPYATALAVP